MPNSCHAMDGNEIFGRSCIRFSMKLCYACAVYKVYGFRNDQFIGKSTKCIACIRPNFSDVQVFIKSVQQIVDKNWISKWNRKLIFVITFLPSNYKYSHLNIVHIVHSKLFACGCKIDSYRNNTMLENIVCLYLAWLCAMSMASLYEYCEHWHLILSEKFMVYTNAGVCSLQFAAYQIQGTEWRSIWYAVHKLWFYFGLSILSWVIKLAKNIFHWKMLYKCRHIGHQACMK